MLSIAWLIKEVADKQQWGFGRVGGLSGTLPNQSIINLYGNFSEIL